VCVVQPQSDPVLSVRAKSSHGTKRPPVWPCLSVCVSGGVSIACLHPAAGRTMHVELVVRTLHRRMQRLSRSLAVAVVLRGRVGLVTASCLNAGRTQAPCCVAVIDIAVWPAAVIT
jgi:hypothetical protein